MTQPVIKECVSVEDYFRREETSEVKHEFHDGEILSMSGGTYEHSLISLNVAAELRGRLKGSPCRALESNMRARIPRRTLYVYPDSSVVCGEPQFDPADRRRTTIINPKIVVEVLSDSTEAYDRGLKFSYYRTLDSLAEYVLVSQSLPLVETFFRQDGGNWLFAPWSGLDATVHLRSLGIDLPLAEIYAGVMFPTEQE